MATKRMFAKSLTNSDVFLDMPLSSQTLYFHLSMNADDAGFINNPKSILRLTGAKEDDLKVLLSKNFVLAFDSGVVVIKHWHVNNYIRQDRSQKTKCADEFKRISIIDDIYEYLPDNHLPTSDNHLSTSDNHLSTSDNPDKNRIDKYKDIVEHDNFCKEKIPYKKIIDYLNLKAKTNFKHTTNSTKQKIRARFNEGFTEQDFYDVIDIKIKDWLSNENMCQYLRPDTLFGTKFESYLNQNNILQPNTTNQVFDYDLPSIDQVGDLF